MTMKQKLEQGIKDAICSRGKRKGLLKAKCPPMNTYGASVWNAMMTYSNPYKVGLGHLFFMDKDKKEVFNKVLDIGLNIDLTKYDRDGNNLRDLNLI